MPQLLADKRRKLMNLLQEAETERKAAADALADGENAVRAADQALREAQELAVHIARGSCAARGPARSLAGSAMSTASGASPRRCNARRPRLSPPPASTSTRSERTERDRAQAAQPARGPRAPGRRQSARRGRSRGGRQRSSTADQRERDDLVQAINKLRGGISSLNREGRQRLLDAFGTVNEKFGELFTTLFGGGKAELQLIESDDPLEAGLEIMANPPGKKPTVLSLLSGGEQTLTALSLIFAVFLTNPSPICVLDEVDAPLDDHNVERFCNLLDAMLERTETRFLIITHHALTMARMHRLFGVTMMERGVSQLVSVNLQQAEAMAEAS